jgi:hypothetical protein
VWSCGCRAHGAVTLVTSAAAKVLPLFSARLHEMTILLLLLRGQRAWYCVLHNNQTLETMLRRQTNGMRLWMKSSLHTGQRSTHPCDIRHSYYCSTGKMNILLYCMEKITQWELYALRRDGEKLKTANRF